MKVLITFLFFVISLISYSQISYYNNVISDEDNLSIRNYNGTKIKEIKVVSFNIKDTTDLVGKMESKRIFDVYGNKIEDIFYNNDSSIASSTYYFYDSLNRILEA